MASLEACIVNTAEEGWIEEHEEEVLQTELANLRQVREAAIAHITARDAYFNQYARQSGWHEGRLLDDGSVVRATWAVLRGLVGKE